jgi:hypothetical protein
LEAQKLKKEIQHANKQENNFNWSINGWFVLFIIVVNILFVGGIIYWIIAKKRSKMYNSEKNL